MLTFLKKVNNFKCGDVVYFIGYKIKNDLDLNNIEERNLNLLKIYNGEIIKIFKYKDQTQKEINYYKIKINLENVFYIIDVFLKNNRNIFFKNKEDVIFDILYQNIFTLNEIKEIVLLNISYIRDKEKFFI